MSERMMPGEFFFTIAVISKHSEISRNEHMKISGIARELPVIIPTISAMSNGMRGLCMVDVQSKKRKL